LGRNRHDARLPPAHEPELLTGYRLNVLVRVEVLSQSVQLLVAFLKVADLPAELALLLAELMASDRVERAAHHEVRHDEYRDAENDGRNAR